MRDVAGHQRVDGRERGLDRLALERVAAPEVDQRVLELVLAREHARGERLTAGRVYRVLEPAADDPAHDAWTTRASPDGPGDRTLHWKSNSTPRMTCAGAGYAGWGHHRGNSACIAGSKATIGLNPQGSLG
jgi:hypothetical protein